MMYGCRTLAYRAIHDNFVLADYANTLSPTCNTLQNNTNSSGFIYIYTHERSFCRIVSIIINIRYTSRRIIILCSHFGLCQLVMSIIYHQLRPKKTRGPEVATSISRSIFMSCHDNARHVTFESDLESRTDIINLKGTAYTPNVTYTVSLRYV